MNGRPRAALVLSGIYVLLTANSWWQAAIGLLRHADEPRALAAMHLVLGTVAAVVAWGCWRVRQWTPFAAIAYGVGMGAMIVSLGPMLDLPPEARGGLWLGGATVFALGVLTAWLMRRAASTAAPVATPQR